MTDLANTGAAEALPRLSHEQIERVGAKLFVDALQYHALLTPIGTPAHASTVLTVLTIATAQALAAFTPGDHIGTVACLLARSLEDQARSLQAQPRENVR